MTIRIFGMLCSLIFLIFSYRLTFADAPRPQTFASGQVAWDEMTSGKYRLSLKNNTSEKVSVALHYHFGGQTWKTEGYYTLQPFEGPVCVSAYKTSYRYIFLFAKSESGAVWKPSDKSISVQCHNDVIECYQLNMGGGPNYLYNLNPSGRPAISSSNSFNGRWQGAGLIWSLVDVDGVVRGELDTPTHHHLLDTVITQQGVAKGTCYRQNRQTGRVTAMTVTLYKVQQNGFSFVCYGTDGKDDLPTSFTQELNFTKL